MDIVTPQNFYVYTLTNSLDGQVFYVGKGIGGRIHAHESEARRGVQSPKCDLIRSIWINGGQVQKSKAHEHLAEGDAYLLENQLINQYGWDNLTNRLGGVKGNQNARGKRKPPEKQLVLVGVSVSGKLRDQIEECMAIDGISYSKENCYQYVKEICFQALQRRVQEKRP